MLWAFYFNNDILYTVEMTSLYWSRALECTANLLWPTKDLYIWTVHHRQCQVTSCHITDQPGYCQGPLATLENTWLHHYHQYSTSELEESGTIHTLRPSQWETSLQSKAVSHWPGANVESVLHLITFCCGLALVDLTLIPQGYCTGTYT